jgi:hypothetical protein
MTRELNVLLPRDGRLRHLWKSVSRLSVAPTIVLFLGIQLASAATFDVINASDTGAGSLRQAMIDANANPGLDTITFHIGSGVQTITPTQATQLPAITSPVVIDGSTQPGFAGSPLIEISAAIVGNNGNALVIEAGGVGSTIRSLVINNGWSTAIFLNGSNCVVEGCFLGTDPTGLIARSNTQGVNLNFGANVSGTRIGGTTAAARNLISGNAVGVIIQSGSNSVVEGNFIGTDITGSVALANATDVDVESNNNVIGGTTAAARNIIAGSGNTTGILVGNATANQIQGNFIGTDVTGTHPLGFANGIFLNSHAANTLIGGLTATPGAPPGNVISASGTGVFVQQNVSNNTIQGNLIGTNAAGTGALPNSLDGINIQGGSNLVGGNTTTARNIISGNGGNGISIGTNNAVVHDNLIQGNFIGPDITGTQLLGNGGDGIFVQESINNTVGGSVTTAGAPPANVIAGNGGRGVGISFGAFGVTAFSIKGNSIFSNGALGIDLNRDGVTLNDAGDLDSGTNNLQNFPVITSAGYSGSNVRIIGTLDTLPLGTYHIEFFGNSSINPSGFGEGQTFIGSTDVVANGSGHATFDVTLPAPAGLKFVTTATDASGNTSEFSAPGPGQLVNISTRLRVLTGDNVLIGGIIITGNDNKHVVLRAIGPSLVNPPFNIAGALQDPTIDLHNGNGAIIASNDNWKDTQQAEIAALGLGPTNDQESAISTTLAPGSYTAIVQGKNGGTGVGLVEAYDVDLSADSRLFNISTRGFVDVNDNVMIGGFIVGGAGGSAKVVVRAIGPSLARFQIQGFLPDPTLSLFDVNGQIATNDDWKQTQQAEIEATGFQPVDDKESAILMTLPAGSYTAIVRGVNSTTGLGQVEVFNVP